MSRSVSGIVETIERVVVLFLIALMLIATGSAIFDLTNKLYHEIFIEPPFLMLDPRKLFEFFRLFLIILIALELLKLLRIRLNKEGFNVEIVIEVTLIALCNEIITLDYHEISGVLLMGISSLLLAISGSFFVFRRYKAEH